MKNAKYFKICVSVNVIIILCLGEGAQSELTKKTVAALILGNAGLESKII